MVTRENLMKAWTPFTLNSGKNAVYGYGFYSDKRLNKAAIYHNGFIFGYSTSDMYFPEDDLLILVVSNISDINVINTNAIIFDIASTIYKREVPELTTDLLDTYVGTYKMKQGFGAKVSREGKQLLVSVDGGKNDKLFPGNRDVICGQGFSCKSGIFSSNKWRENGYSAFYGTKPI